MKEVAVEHAAIAALPLLNVLVHVTELGRVTVIWSLVNAQLTLIGEFPPEYTPCNSNNPKAKKIRDFIQTPLEILIIIFKSPHRVNK